MACGPLSEGTLKDGSVVCPFAIEGGQVINGPATQNQPTLDVRERGGRIDVKSRS